MGFCDSRLRGNEVNIQPKTLQEHTEYLREIVRLKLWFLFRWLQDKR